MRLTCLQIIAQAHLRSAYGTPHTALRWTTEVAAASKIDLGGMSRGGIMSADWVLVEIAQVACKRRYDLASMVGKGQEARAIRSPSSEP